MLKRKLPTQLENKKQEETAPIHVEKAAETPHIDPSPALDEETPLAPPARPADMTADEATPAENSFDLSAADESVETPQEEAAPFAFDAFDEPVSPPVADEAPIAPPSFDEIADDDVLPQAPVEEGEALENSAPAPFSFDEGENDPFMAPPSFEEETLSAPQSARGEAENALPWATPETPSEAENTWDSENFLSDAPIAPEAGDVYGDLSTSQTAPTVDTAGTAPWQTPGAAPAELPESSKPQGQKNNMASNLFILGLVGCVLYGGYWFLSNKDTTAERVGRWTNTLNHVSEELPEGTEAAGDLVTPDEVVTFNQQEQDALDEPAQVPDEEALLVDDTGDDQDASQDDAQNTVVEFVDVPEDEADEPITAGEEKEMPKELSVFAQMQKELVKATEDREAKRIKKLMDGKVSDKAAREMEPEEIVRRNAELSARLEEELAAYRKALATTENPALKPKPAELLKENNAYQQAAQTPKNEVGVKTPSGAIPEPQKNRASAGAVYGANPYDLPSVPEPTTKQVRKATGVRTLDDFDVTMFAPEEPRVRIPRGLRPRLRATDFPEMHLLSLVPGRGVIAHAKGQEGVLLIGESFDGWELIAVEREYAEFSNGNRKHVVSLYENR